MGFVLVETDTFYIQNKNWFINKESINITLANISFTLGYHFRKERKR